MTCKQYRRCIVLPLATFTISTAVLQHELSILILKIVIEVAYYNHITFSPIDVQNQLQS